MDLHINLDFLNVLGAAVDIKYGRLVILREAILKIVAYEARFSDSSVADKHNFYRLRSVGVGWLRRFLWYRPLLRRNTSM